MGRRFPTRSGRRSSTPYDDGDGDGDRMRRESLQAATDPDDLAASRRVLAELAALRAW